MAVLTLEWLLFEMANFDMFVKDVLGFGFVVALVSGVLVLARERLIIAVNLEGVRHQKLARNDREKSDNMALCIIKIVR